MIKKYIFGNPIFTNATVKDIERSDGGIPYFKYDDKGEFTLKLADEDIVYGLGEQIRGMNKRGLAVCKLEL